MKKVFFVLFLVTTTVFCQKKVNNYKYVIVPTRFDFLKKEDQYKANSLTKFLFKKYGFTVFLDNEKLPKELGDNRCLALTGTIKDDSGMFTVKSIVQLKDCYNNIVFSSKVGKSKLKDYKKGYHEAIRDAFKSVQALKYKYNSEAIKVVDISKKEVVTPIVKEVKVVDAVKTINIENNVLYAQPINNGFQLVNTKPERVYEILNTSVKDVFVLKNKKGILFKNKDKWIVEYYEDTTKVVKHYSIKF
ncbi:hypothetical protein DS884_03460 [Tenacibaculum sp. E3R01]|uniref:hypothetical protein n=1 Tax=Tenacibaculum sp. E3R01 TaxID=2267227 RepID=UPI000DE9391F|nr:hypothetical protein [Tenacibaculum sp. E3R01]RBW61379.1 hypothetical protein DS884_03460 [Tenacibaculum sp. E3R01]